jgi:hypothetical protein
MADVIRRGAGRRDPETKGRGQLIIVTALSLAILFVTLALILNTAIYTENLATRSGDIGGATDAVRYHDAARDGVGGVIDYANANNNTSHSTLQSNLSTGVDDFRNNSARLFASGDRAVEVTLDDSVDGTRIAQSEENRNFTNRSGATTDWVVSSNVDNTRAFKMNVTDDALLDTSLILDNRFHVEVYDGTNEWNLYVYEDTAGSDIIIEVENPSGGGGTCTAESVSSVWINVTDGTLGDEACEYLSFAEGVDGTYDLTFRNPDVASGTYSLIVDNSTLADSPGPHLHEDGSGQPFAAHAIYSANVTVVYETSRLYYNTTVRVAPGETDG